MTSLRDSILNADDLGEEIIDVPEWVDKDGNPAKVLVQGMDGVQRSKIQKLASSQADTANAKILVLVARDPDTRELIFDKADVDAVSHKSGKAVEDVVLAAIRMSGASPDEATAEVEGDPFSDGV